MMKVSEFYSRYSVQILCAVALSFPLLYHEAETIPSNNDIETWLPEDSDVRVTYERFKKEFGAEELIIVGLPQDLVDSRLEEAVTARIEHLPGIRKCWSPNRLREVMEELAVEDEEIDRRLGSFIRSKQGNLFGLICVLSEEGLEDRIQTVQSVKAELDYCQLKVTDTHLAGAPVVVAELDRLGSRENNKQFFLITLAISLGLLYYTIRQWKLTFTILGLTVWAINLTLACVKWIGGEMNFIMGALSVMVMVFTLAVSIHFIHYYRTASGKRHALDEAFRLAWKPCSLATLTTTIGLVSLTVSDILPVRQFGYAAAIGSIAALITGLGLTPAVLAMWPNALPKLSHGNSQFAFIANRILDNKKYLAAGSLLLVFGTSLGLTQLYSRVDPLDFLPKSGKVLADVQRIEHDLTSGSSIEAVIDFGDEEIPFVDKLHHIRNLEAIVLKHPDVRHTSSLAEFFPNEMPDNPLALADMLSTARSQQGQSDFVADGGRRCRVSIRTMPSDQIDSNQTFDELSVAVAGFPFPVTMTGVAPLLDSAQREIFDGFWESFATAFGIITLVMIVSLRSLKAGAVAMIPNLTPICIVFGSLGWLGIPVDIGMMMTGSIALGIAVDGTFHFLVRYEERYKESKDSCASARFALIQTGAPIFEAAIIAAIGMLALTLSSFNPTARFGYMMATLLLAALIGDLVLLPALLSLRPRTQANDDQQPEIHTASHLIAGEESRRMMAAS